jgi:hypothetical protein
MPKKWDELSQPEKIEELRRDMLRIYDAFNALASDVGRTWSFTRETSAKLSAVAKAVEALEDRLPTARPKKK